LSADFGFLVQGDMLFVKNTGSGEKGLLNLLYVLHFQLQHIGANDEREIENPSRPS
jgi:hypothetical protein